MFCQAIAEEGKRIDPLFTFIERNTFLTKTIKRFSKAIVIGFFLIDSGAFCLSLIESHALPVGLVINAGTIN